MIARALIAAAALLAGTASAADLIRTGLCEASAAAILPGGRLAVASDELDELAVYDRRGIVPDWSEDLGKVDDIEAAARIGETVFWITSHGFKEKTKKRKKRRKLLATQAGANGLPEERGRKFDEMIATLTEALKGAGVALAADDLERSLDIEGLAAITDGALLIGIRAPLAENGNALLVLLPEPFGLLALDQPPGGPAEARVIALDLQRRGIRAMARDPDGSFVVIAGPSGDGERDLERGFAFYRWRVGADPEPVPDADLSGMKPEAVVVWESGLAEVFGDNARACRKKDGRMPPPEERWFPGRLVRY